MTTYSNNFEVTWGDDSARGVSHPVTNQPKVNGLGGRGTKPWDASADLVLRWEVGQVTGIADGNNLTAGKLGLSTLALGKADTSGGANLKYNTTGGPSNGPMLTLNAAQWVDPANNLSAAGIGTTTPIHFFLLAAFTNATFTGYSEVWTEINNQVPFRGNGAGTTALYSGAMTGYSLWVDGVQKSSPWTLSTMTSWHLYEFYAAQSGMYSAARFRMQWAGTKFAAALVFNKRQTGSALAGIKSYLSTTYGITIA